MKRRDFLRAGVAAGVAGSAAGVADADIIEQIQDAQRAELLQDLCPPDNFPDQLAYEPSPIPEDPEWKFKADLFVMPVKQPVQNLEPPPDPRAHQRYSEFRPKKLYEIRQNEFQWAYHPDAPYSQNGKGVTWGWGFDNMTPGPTYHARYGEPVLVRMINNLPNVGQSKATFALPSTTIHLHNFHTASESDGNPVDWIDPGEFWDHHYANYPSGGDPREKLTTLWYHDHRLDFTASNVYAGLSGFYLLFDEHDTGNENDASPDAWRLPSGKYDVPLMLHDVKFQQNGQVAFSGFETDGWLGDMITLNRTIFPRFKVERRKYRFRIINGGPSRFYQLFLSDGYTKNGRNYKQCTESGEYPMTIVTGDGNFLPEPVDANSIYLSVAQRVDVIIDFSKYKPGEHVFLENRLVQTNGKGPSGDRQDGGDPWDVGIMRFDVADEPQQPDPSRVPDYFRATPPVDLSEVKFHRTWDFDYDGGLWTINERVMDNNRVDAGCEQGSAEIWTLRNTGNDWAHPIHCHFTEFIILEIDGRPVFDRWVQVGREVTDIVQGEPTERMKVRRFMGGPRRDVATILPNNEMKVFFRFKDFYGKYVMHCHNVVHEDHAMMIRWDIVEPGKGFQGPRPASEVDSVIHLEVRPGQATIQE